MRVILRGNNNQSEINIPAQCQWELYMKVLLAILIAHTLITIFWNWRTLDMPRILNERVILLKALPQKAQNSLLVLESNKDTSWSTHTPCEIDDSARQDMHIDACSYLAHVSGAPPARVRKGTTPHGRLSYPPSIPLLLHWSLKIQAHSISLIS